MSTNQVILNEKKNIVRLSIDFGSKIDFLSTFWTQKPTSRSKNMTPFKVGSKIAFCEV